MDNEIFNRYKELEPPFNGEVLYTKDIIPLDKLRRLVKETINYLKENDLMYGKVYKVWDWFEHDGYLRSKELVSDEFFTELTKNNEKFYEYRSGDTYVKLGLYDELSRWYIRIYIIDECDLGENDEIGGEFDISLNEELLYSLQNYLVKKEFRELEKEESKVYFEKRYAGL